MSTPEGSGGGPDPGNTAGGATGTEPGTGTATADPPATDLPATDPGAADASETHLSNRPRVRRFWTAVRLPAAIILLVTIGTVISAVIAGQPVRGTHDPESVDPTGSKAVAQLARERGGNVVVARSVGQAARSLGPNTLLVLARGERLLEADARRLATLPGDRLLISPPDKLLKGLAPGITAAGSAPPQTLRPACDLPAARAAGEARVGGDLYTAGGQARQAALCYPTGGEAPVVQARTDGRTVTVFGSGDPFTNRYLDEDGNAALALNLLDDRPTVVWLIPDLPEAGSAAGEEDPQVLPPAFDVILLELALVVLLTALWRMRRLGPVVRERLPVIVRASETTEGRGRLYLSRRAGDRAAAALRQGALDRLLPRLGLARGASQVEVVNNVAARTGRDPGRIAFVLYGAGEAVTLNDRARPDDAALVRLADELDTLEREVRQS